MLVEDIEFKVTKITHIQLTTVRPKKKYLQILTRMRVNELYGFSMVSLNYVSTNRTYV